MILMAVFLADAGVYERPVYCQCTGIGVKPQAITQIEGLPISPDKNTFQSFGQRLENWMIHFFAYMGL